MNVDDALVKELAQAIDDSDLMGCGCCGIGYEYDKYESRTEAIVAEVIVPLLRGRTDLRFCSLRRDCRMADGHEGGCQP